MKTPEEMKIYHKEHYKKNRAKRLLQAKEYYENNKDKRKEYIDKNKEKLTQVWKDYHIKNQSKRKEYFKEYRGREDIKNKTKIHNALRYQEEKPKLLNSVHKKRANSFFTDIDNQWLENLINDTTICEICNNKIKKKSIDHIKPISTGGLHQKSNVRIVCLSCNLKRPRNGSDIKLTLEYAK